MPDDSRRGRLTVAVSSLLLAAGVFVLDWDVRVLLLCYWLEAGFVVARDAVQSLFAARPPADAYRPSDTRAPFPLSALAAVRGGIEVAGLPPLYPRNVPHVLLTLLAFCALWPLAGLAVSGALGPAPYASFPPGAFAAAAATFGVGQAIRLVEWGRTHEFETAAATGGLTRRYLVFLVALAFAVPPVFAAAEASGVPDLVLGTCLVATRATYGLAEARHPGFVRSLVYTDETVGDADPVETPDTDPVATHRTDPWGTTATAVLHGALVSVLGPTAFLVLLAGLVGMTVGGAGFSRPALGAVAGALCIVASRSLVAVLIEARVAEAPLVYRVHADALVAHNGLTDAAQWVTPRATITDATVSRTRLVPGADTVRVECADGTSRTLRHVSNAEALAARLAP
ncbi:hypothetical protein J2752_001152 [Halarchaeum rubridurum]|nr:DUF6498-containing protein [Halarchaeum rubridurum]MBP1954271.1 hypothetical protein [Halarchaeum rubridurum]